MKITSGWLVSRLGLVMGIVMGWVANDYLTINPKFSYQVPKGVDSFWACYVDTDNKMGCMPIEQFMHQVSKGPNQEVL